ncbi:peroxidase-related enzyme [uncultured Roseovarius sp.]|uniref:carboxymuconolactone decarboxylase family protein n=1 Tax=uncultured Roseovarius sp. TaxID=293344 RepID=UPI0026D5DA44|tara:strand:- start:6 stop:581 length:576 start_codon:yes stop_codon:yes gene_type:complete
MPLLPSLPDPAHLMDLHARFPRNVRPLMEYTDGLLRSDGELSIGQRELIATYVSALNACTFCAGAHRAYAEVFGIDAGLIDALIADVDTAPIDEKLRPLLAYVAKLNTLPSKLVARDAQAVYDAGWSEAALYEAVQVCALFNMMNRIIEGTGVNFDYAEAPEGHPATGTTPEDQAATYSRFGAMVEAMVKG